MPTTKQVKRALLQELPELSRGKIVELGSGFGGVAFLLARRYSHLKVEAYELSIVPFIVSFSLSKLFRLKNLTLIRRDFLSASLEEASLLYAYLCPKGMEALREKCGEEKVCGTLISSTFHLPNSRPIKVQTINDLYQTKLFVYDLKSVFLSTRSIS